jgi:type II secretory pathway component PulJ
MKNNLSKKIVILMALSCLLGMASFDSAQAKVTCSEGRTASGKRIKPVMAAVQRKIMVAFTQPKISQSSKLIFCCRSTRANYGFYPKRHHCTYFSLDIRKIAWPFKL